VRDAGHPTYGQHPQRQAPAEPPLLTSHLELGPLLTAARTARGHVEAVLTEWGLGELSDVTELLVSELMTNAVLATQALNAPLPFPVRLWVHATRKRVLVTVWDADPQPPVLRKDVDVWAESGRGLQILDVLSSRWGWYEPPVVGGKCVWCEIPRSSAY
jgi:anti-sigma regulatory factor (Ser/Thr protein kinase)